MKLAAIKSRYGKPTAYHASIGCREAREAGFILEDGTRLELVKHINRKNHTMTIKLAKVQPALLSRCSHNAEEGV
jgi:hypothetical protein